MSEEKIKSTAKRSVFFSFFKLGLILFIITLTTGLLLAGINELTKNIIEKQGQEALQNSMKLVFDKADSFIDGKIEPTKQVENLYIAKAGEETLGYAIIVKPKGFNGEIKMVVAIDKDNKVSGVNVISLSETPGLGTNIKNPEFIKQFFGKGQDIKVVKGEPVNKTDISAVSGATISSKAFTEGIKYAFSTVNAFTTGSKG